MVTQTGIGKSLAELVERLLPEEKQEFVHWLSWDELVALRREETVLAPVEESVAQPVRRVGDPQVYVSTTPDGLSLELPVACVAAFVKRLPTLLSVSVVEVYLRRNGKGQEFQVAAEEFAKFLKTHQDALQEDNVMMEFGNSTLVSGGGGCISLALDEISRGARCRLATESLRVCGFDYEFVGDNFTATVWDDELEVHER
ncbi:MAG: hypothetical protein KKD28_02095 [Chloroflexi bacterium]|nr:hypothetical protein [Chloroflexota bacterium]